MEPLASLHWLCSYPRQCRGMSYQCSAHSTRPTPLWSIWDVLPGTIHVSQPVYHSQCVHLAYHTYPGRSKHVPLYQPICCQTNLRSTAAPAEESEPEEEAEVVPRCQLNPASSPILLQTSHDQLTQRECPLQRETELAL